MASKKLKVEVELETAKAKKQIDTLAQDGAAPSGPSPVDEAASRTARQIRDLGDETDKCKINMKGAVKAFAGMGVGMAMNYAANYLPQGSSGREAIEYGAGAIQGASMGMMFGPWGAAIGAAGGLAKTYLDKQGEKAQHAEDWQRAEHDYAENQAWSDFMKSLNNQAHVKTTYAERIQKANEALKKYQETEKKQVDAIGQMISDGRFDDASKQRAYLAQNRARQQALKDAIFSMEESSKNDGVRVSASAVDALSRIGGDFTGGGGQSDEMLRVEHEQVELLKSIDRKTGAASWQ